MILIVDCGYTAIERLEELIYDYDDYHTLSIYDINEENLSKITVDGVLISHTQLSVYEQNIDPYVEQVNKLIALNKPILGVGFGHQIIGIALGAFSSYSSYFNGETEVEIYGESELFQKLPSLIHVIKEQAGTISVPPGFSLIASSDSNINEAMQNTKSSIYGIQFFPENSGTVGATIIDNFISRICLDKSHLESF